MTICKHKRGAWVVEVHEENITDDKYQTFVTIWKDAFVFQEVQVKFMISLKVTTEPVESGFDLVQQAVSYQRVH